MKRTLRFTCLVFTAFVMGVAANAQRAIPLAVSVAAPTANQEIPYSEAYYTIIRIENLSTTETLLASDTAWIMLEGEPDFPANGNFFATVSLPEIAPGAFIMAPIFANPNWNDTGEIINKEYCVVIVGTADAAATGSWYNSSPLAFEPACVSFKLMPEEGSNPTSVTEVDTAVFSIYPNPANEVINISTQNMPADAIITVHNAMGQRVFEQKANDFRAMGTINTSSWNSGVYMVSVTSNGESTTQRVTVQH